MLQTIKNSFIKVDIYLQYLEETGEVFFVDEVSIRNEFEEQLKKLKKLYNKK